jgi:tetratricopeptide (TPR) repeat protein
MNEIVTCPECRRRLKLPAEYVGKSVTCPECSTTFTAGLGQATPPAPDPAMATAMTDAPANPEPHDEPEPPRRRKARLRPEAPPPRRKRALFILAALMSIFALCVFCGLLGFFNERGVPIFDPNVPMRQFGDAAPPANPPAMNPEQNLQDMKAFFQKLSQGIRARDVAAVAICFDGKRTIDELAAQPNLQAQFRNNNRMEPELNQGFARGLLQQEAQWAHHEIRHIQVAGPQELIVVTQHRSKVIGSVRYRWWLTARQGTWRIYDLEDLDLGLRTSYLLGIILDRGVNQIDRQLVQDVNSIKNATQALVVRQDVDEADRHLSSVKVHNLPMPMAGAYHMLRGVIRIRQQRFEESLASCDEALLCHPDMPGIDWLRAIAYNSLKKFDQALDHARKYHDLVGDDADVCFQIGLVLQELRRFKEAASYYRRALDDDPTHHDSFFNLLRCIGGNEGTHNQDIGERFLKLERPQDQFEECAQDCRQANDHSTLEKLAEALRKLDPRHADAAFYLAIARGELRKHEAFEAFRSALPLQTLPARREHYYNEFARCLTFQGQALDAYARLPDPVLAFRSLALALKNSARFDDLQDLVDQHRKKKADDVYLQIYQAELYAHEEQFAMAAMAYDGALAKIDDVVLLDTIRPNRVFVRYRMGDVLGAYRDIGPQRATFDQLAQICWQDRNADSLAALVTAHAKNDANDPKLPQARWRAKICQGNFDEAAAIMKATLATAQGDEERKQQRESFLFDMIDANQSLAAYQFATDPSETFGVIVNDLLEAHKLASLKELSEAHRKKFPKDPLVSICAGEIALSEKNWAKAAKEYTEGWKTLPEAQRSRWQYSYVFARCKAGQALQAYQDTGKRRDIFRDIARNLVTEKQADLFEQLIEAHRPQRKDDPHFDAYEARLKVLRGKPAEAAEQFARCWKSAPQPERPALHADFVDALILMDTEGIAAYTYAPDKRAAFQQLAWRYRNAKEAKRYERLIQEHVKNDPSDPKLPLERGELHLLRGEPAIAEQIFAVARDKGDKNDDYSFRSGLIRARVRLGKIAQSYREFGPSNQTFLDLAGQCVFEKNPDQLQALLAAHRQSYPGFRNAAVWELEIGWLKKDYDGTVRRIQADRARLLTNPNVRWKTEGYLVRSLVRLQKPKEALQEAETFNRRKNGPNLLVALALAATGDVPRLIAFAEAQSGQPFFIDDAYRDEDTGRLLRSAAFQKFRDRFPEPPPLNP